MNDVVYFELNNWFSGRDYPKDGILAQYVESHQFSNDYWCKENKLCVLSGNVDMSTNWCISATYEWVVANCPELLSDKKYKYSIISYYKWEETTNEYEKAYSDFVRHEDEYGDVEGQFGWTFLQYDPENFGVTYHEDE